MLQNWTLVFSNLEVRLQCLQQVKTKIRLWLFVEVGSNLRSRNFVATRMVAELVSLELL